SALHVRTTIAACPHSELRLSATALLYETVLWDAEVWNEETTKCADLRRLRRPNDESGSWAPDRVEASMRTSGRELETLRCIGRSRRVRPSRPGHRLPRHTKRMGIHFRLWL